MNLSSLMVPHSVTIQQTPVQPQLLFSNVPFQFGAVPLQVYVLENPVGLSQTLPGGQNTFLTTPSSLIQPPVIQAVKRSTSYPTSPLKIRTVTPTVVSVVST